MDINTTLVQCWTTDYNAGLTLNRCFEFTGINKQRLAINDWLLRAFSRRHWSKIHLFNGVSVILTCQILITFLSDGSVLQCQITKIPLSCEISTIIFLTPEMLSFNLVYNTYCYFLWLSNSLNTAVRDRLLLYYWVYFQFCNSNSRFKFFF